MTDVSQSWVPRSFFWTTGLLIAMGAVLFSYDALMEFRTSGQVSPLGLFNAGCFVFLALTSGSWLWNRMRCPVLLIDDEVVQFSPFVRFLRPLYRVPMREIEDLPPSKESVLVLRMRSGKVRRFTLFEVRKRDREAVREAIRRHLSAATS